MSRVRADSCKVCGGPRSDLSPLILCDVHFREYRIEYSRRRYAADPERQRAASKAWQQANAVRLHLVHGAGGYVRWALATGLLQKPDACERCGSVNRVLEAAHADYSRPLDVNWLCKPCHGKWDRNHPKTMPELGMFVAQ